MASTDLHFNITWDTEPSEQAKAFVRKAVLEALREALTDSKWLKEIVQAEVSLALTAPVIHVAGREITKAIELHLRDRGEMT